LLFLLHFPQPFPVAGAFIFGFIQAVYVVCGFTFFFFPYDLSFWGIGLDFIV